MAKTSLTKFISNINLANVGVAVSLFCSISALVIVAKISAEKSQQILSIRDNKIVETNKDTHFKATIIKQDNNSPSIVSMNEDRFIDREVNIGGADINSFSGESEDVEKKMLLQAPARTSMVQSVISNSEPQFDTQIDEISTPVSNYSKSESIVLTLNTLNDKRGTNIVPVKTPERIRAKESSTVIRSSHNAATAPKGKFRDISLETLGDALPSSTHKAQQGNNDNSSGVATMVELGSFKTHSEAIAGWFRLKKGNPNILNNNTSHSIETSQSGGEVHYKLYIEAKSNTEAVDVCNKLRAKGNNCKVISN